VGAVGWTDRDGNFWLFGGLGTVFWESRDFSEIDQYDLWKFNSSTRKWAWMSGNSTSMCGESSSEDSCAQNGIFGIQGTPALANNPPSRDAASVWTDSAGNLWLFGGEQPDETNGGGEKLCNDVWVFEPAANEWAWMSGAPQIWSCDFTPATFGVLGTPAAADTPSGRLGAATWTDSSGNLWVFGGYGWGNPVYPIDLNDFWIYRPLAPVPEPSFEVIASPNPVNIAAVGAGTSTITTGTTKVSILVAGGFTSPVTLTCCNAAFNGVTGMTGSFNPVTITGDGTSTLTMSVPGAAVGIAELSALQITATSGAVSQSILVIVDVTDIGFTPAPTFSVPGGTYSTPQTVAVTNDYGDSQFIYYTLDGTTPTASSPVYVNPITITSTTTLKAFAMDVANYQSAMTTATYTIVPNLPRRRPILSGRDGK